MAQTHFQPRGYWHHRDAWGRRGGILEKLRCGGPSKRRRHGGCDKALPDLPSESKPPFKERQRAAAGIFISCFYCWLLMTFL